MILRFIPIVLLVSLLSWGAPAMAADATFFGPIVPPECNCEVEGGISTAPDWGCVLATVQNGVNFAISISFIIATLYIIYSGFMFVASAGNPSTREVAKKRLTNVVVGIVLVLCAWLIVDFIMKTLYNPDAEVAGETFGPWNSILRGVPGDEVCFEVTDIPTALPGVTAVPGSSSRPGVVGEGEVTHAQGAELLTAAGVEVKSGASVNGTRRDTINQVIAIREACRCSITVTSGTDGSHAGGAHSHANGYKIDLRLQDDLNTYLQALRRSGSRSGDPRYLDACGNEYVREADHWDISVTRGVCSPPR